MLTTTPTSKYGSSHRLALKLLLAVATVVIIFVLTHDSRRSSNSNDDEHTMLLEVPSVSTQDDIVNGVNADNNEFPFAVSLQYGGDHFCGGSLISEWKVLTAAHCCEGKNMGHTTIYAGEQILTNSYGQRKQLLMMTWHENYDAAKLKNDICILTLTSPVSLNSQVGLANLPSQGASTATGTSVIAAGWGKTSTSGSVSKYLKKTTMSIVSDSTCDNYYTTFSSDMICGQSSRSGTCNGDSGGPLVKASDKKALIGVASYVSSTACGTNVPDGFAEVSHFVNWINARKTRTFEILNLKSGKALDCQNGDRGKTIVQWDKNQQSQQKFEIVDAGSGYVYIKCTRGGKVLDITGGSTSNGADAVLWDMGSNAHHRQFKLIPSTVHPGRVKIQVRKSGKYLGVTGKSTSNGAVIQQWSDNGEQGNMIFTFYYTV